MNILSLIEEEKLSINQRTEYYQELKDYLLTTPYENLSVGSLTICPFLNPIVRNSLKKICGYDIIVKGNNYKGLLGIYAFTHQDKFDHINFVVSNPNHTILLNSVVLAPVYKAMLNLNGVVYVDKNNKEDKKRAKLDLMRLLYSNKSITIFPESAWNLSPNKLHLPLYIGMIDMARKTGVPIIPAVQEYEYINKNDGKEHINYVCVSFGKPIVVNPNDDLFKKLNEVSEAFSTLRYQEYEKKGMFLRKDLTNKEYINFICASKRNLKNAGIDINVEQQFIFGADNPFYQNHFINAVGFNRFGELLDSPPITNEQQSQS